MLFSAIFLSLMFLNIRIDWIILKTYDLQFTLTTKKSLHIIFNNQKNHCVSSLSSAPEQQCKEFSHIILKMQ